jgi:hypothetical protein
MPDQDFYELKHRAIQWMVDPIEDGDLGLDPPTVATMVGHDDGGYLIAHGLYQARRTPSPRPRLTRWTPTSNAGAEERHLRLVVDD